MCSDNLFYKSKCLDKRKQTQIVILHNRDNHAYVNTPIF